MAKVYLETLTSEELSPEDISWVDSCLLKDADDPESNWETLKDDLMDIISAQADMTYNYGILSEDDKGGSRSEKSGVARDTADPSNLMDDNDSVFLNGTSKNDVTAGEESDGAASPAPSISQVNPFRATYREGVESWLVDPGFDSDSSSSEFSPRSNDIFRVWDLDLPSEEDELVKQLEKALSGSSSKSIPALDDSAEGNDLKDLQGESLDELIAGFADISLSHD